MSRIQSTSKFHRALLSILSGAAFGILTAYFGTYIGHLVESSPTPEVMYARDSHYFWLQIPSLLGEAMAVLSTSRDWLRDEAWLTYRDTIALWNAIFWAGAFSLFAAILAFIRSRLRRTV